MAPQRSKAAQKPRRAVAKRGERESAATTTLTPNDAPASQSKTSTAKKPTRRTKPKTVSSPIIERALEHLKFSQGKHRDGATTHDFFVSMALAARDAAFEKMIYTHSGYAARQVKRVYYLSLEFLLGRLLRSNLVNLGAYESCRNGLAELGRDIDRICEVEPDAGLGNGGLGRLAACYLDSAATLELPVYGYGIRYEYGIFHQRIQDGWQIEEPEYWLQYGSPWEVVRPEFATQVRLYGRVQPFTDAKGNYRPRWNDCTTILGVPYDIPIVGYKNETVNILRLWSSKASNELDMEVFNRGGYLEAVREKVLSETVSKVLYPVDRTDKGRTLRLIQEYFFVACTLADIMRRYDREYDSIDRLPDKIAVQMNDTHPSLAVAELMRILVDERVVDWDRAWEMTVAICAYTNHTLLPEALETWPVEMLGKVLPRHLEIIYEINRRFLSQVEERWPGDIDRKRSMSLIRETEPRSVRMAHLAIVGSRKINGVAELHSRLLRERLAPGFAEFWPDRFTNVTNGVTPRRWLLACNPLLAKVISDRIGDEWVRDLSRLGDLAALADDPQLQAEVRQAKHRNKCELSAWIKREIGLHVDPEALFDVQVKRLHEYKRQLLNILRVVMCYQELIENPQADIAPRVVLFAAKAAPSYRAAKLIIKLICDVARTINHDDRIGDRLRVAFLPGYKVSLAERLIPAADLSEQISTAGMEASGTGNMKLALNGALTIGTLDGANIEIREAVGEQNFFLFGLTAEQVEAARRESDAWTTYWDNSAVRSALDAIADGAFNTSDRELFRPVRDWLTGGNDYYKVMADIESYCDAQRRVDNLWRSPSAWDRAVICNIAQMGRFSSDRSVTEYARTIWGIE